MEYSKRKNEVTCLYWLAILLAFYAEVRFLLWKKNLCLHRGLGLLVENMEQCRKITEYLRDTVSAIEIRKFKEPVLNYLLCLHCYSKKDKEEAIMEFMENERAFCVVVFPRAIPDFLAGSVDIIEAPSAVYDEEMRKSVKAEMDAFRNFVRENPKRIMETQELFRTSKEGVELERKSRFLLSMTAVLKIYEAEYRRNTGELETEEYLCSMKKQLAMWAEQSENYDSEDGYIDMIRNTVLRYLENHPEILLGDINKIEGSLNQAIERGRAILYNEFFYFIPEELFRIICQELLESVSFLHIKKLLAEADVIHNNQLTLNGFTVKRVITNAFGQSQRLRFLKIDKGFLKTESGLYLEELRGDCGVYWEGW